MGFLSNLFKSIKGERVDFVALIQSGAVVVDVRSPQEFKSGHADGSKNIPLQSLSGSLSKLKNKEVILVCKSGGRAARAKSILSNSGIKAHNAGAWQNVS
ncbi:MAG: phage shock protein E [Parvicella sp.]|jgi:phage shock protein E